jgi:hypothetical protein
VQRGDEEQVRYYAARIRDAKNELGLKEATESLEDKIRRLTKEWRDCDDFVSARHEIKAELDKAKDQLASKTKVKEDASAGSSCSSSIAAGPASNLLQKPIKRVKETTSKYKNARPDAFSGSIGKGIYEAIDMAEAVPLSHKLSQQNYKSKQEYLAKGGKYKQEEVPNTNGKGTIWQKKKVDEAEPMSLNAGSNLDPDQFAEDVKKAWHQVMPNSAISARKILGGWTFRFFLVNGKDECANGILDNDPFYYSAHLSREGNFEEQHSSLLVKPTRPHMVYDSVHFRKQTMKAPSFDKLVKRFTKIREWIMSNAENLKGVKFDIKSK